MYPYNSPVALYDEYEARADAAVRKHKLAIEAQPPRGSRRLAWVKLGAWWYEQRRRLERHLQPPEESYIA